MPATKVIKTKPVRPSRKTLRENRPVPMRAAAGAAGGLKVPAVRRSRASSCPVSPQRDGRERSSGARSCDRGVTSRSTANPDCGETRSVRHAAVQSHRAFTVIPPDPNKRREIQRKAEAELAALEELRLSRAMAFVSINPSSVGGCMSLEEVRLKQQQEMMQAKRKQTLV
uniref:Uncharacterized protein n=1 Tax=Mola mola TaxID=94237 RepID=A0A3Q3X047_MOLML